MRKNYRVDEEFKSLIPPLSEAERSQLEESCIKYGIKDSIKIWNLTIVDGHNRYEIAQKHKLPFKVDKIDFKNLAIGIPAFFVIVMMPLGYSISTGIQFGFITYAITSLVTGKGKDVSIIVYVFSVLFIIQYIINAIL